MKKEEAFIRPVEDAKSPRTISINEESVINPYTEVELLSDSKSRDPPPRVNLSFLTLFSQNLAAPL